MATLNGSGIHGKTYKSVARWFSITPVSPGVLGPHDAYDIEFGPDTDDDTVRVRGSVHGWQFGHSCLEMIAENFLNVAALPPLERKRLVTPVVTYRLDWLHVTLDRCSTRREPDCIGLLVYVAEPDPMNNTVSNDKSPFEHRFMLFGFHTTVAEARRFGEDLQREMQDAQAKRIELGIETEEDRIQEYDCESA